MDPYSTHLECIVETCLNNDVSEGILELGCGWYSSPQLRAFAVAGDGDFHIKSSDPKWSAHFKDYAVELVTWAGFKLDRRYSICLLDNEEYTKDRVKRIPHLLEHCAVVIMHDVDKVQHCWFREPDKIYKQHTPWTGVWYASR